MKQNEKPTGYQKFFRDARKSATVSISPEQQVLKHLAAQANSRRRVKRSKRRPPPIFASLLLLVGVAAGVVGMTSPNILDDLSMNWPAGWPKISFGVFGNALAETAARETAKSSEAKSSAGAADTASVKHPAGDEKADPKSSAANPDLRQWSAEEMSFFKTLNDRKSELDRREAELTKVEEELQKERVGIEEKIKQLEKMRAEISETLKGRVEQDKEKVAKLVDVYSNMKPVSASRLIETLNEDLAVTVLDRMKKKNAAEVLNMLSAAKAKSESSDNAGQ